MTQSLIIVGAGGFGRETLELVRAIQGARPELFDLAGVVDDAPSEVNLDRIARQGATYLGAASALPAVAGEDHRFVVGIANPVVRRRLHEVLTDKGYTPAVLLHPATAVGSDVSLGPGSIVCAGARLTANITTGSHVHIHVNATVGHDTTLEDFVSLYPQAAVSGDCLVGAGATIGASATVLQGRSIGAQAFVGAGAVVVHDVPADRIVKGVPAR